MNWHYFYLSKEKIEPETIEAYFAKKGFALDNISLTSVKEGDIFASEKLVLPMFSFVKDQKASGNVVTVLISHADDGWSKMMLHKVAEEYFPGQVSFMSDLILKQMSFGDFCAFSFLSALFREISDESLETGRAYLDAGLDAKLAADILIVHRNTFNYRLKRFIKETGVDIRDYHNALLLDCYLRMRVR